MPASSTQRPRRRGQLDGHAERLEQVGGAAPDEAARLPCLHTGTPAPATTSAARVDTLMLWLRSPPVPTTSMARSTNIVRQVTRYAAASMASSIPVSSSTVSPFTRSATTKAASWAGVACLEQSRSMAARAVPAGEVPAGDRC